MAYLDNTGLAYFWGKIKAWANSVFALLGHTHPSSDVTLMTGYSKPSSSSAISASDSLNQAVGKLEKGLETVDGNVVHKTGTETINGAKTFTSLSTTFGTSTGRSPNIILSNETRNVWLSQDGGAFYILKSGSAGASAWDDSLPFVISFTSGRISTHYHIGLINTSLDASTGLPSVATSRGIQAFDDAGYVTHSLIFYREPTGTTTLHVRVHAPKDLNDFAEIGIRRESDGTKYAFCPTPPAAASTAQIVNAEWARNTFVPTNGNATVNNVKTFTNTVKLSYSNPGLCFHNSNISDAASYTGTDNKYCFICLYDSSGTTNDTHSVGRLWIQQGKDSNTAYSGIRLDTWTPDANHSHRGVVFYSFVNGACLLFPTTDNVTRLGNAAHRWSQLFAATATINTSDERQKSFISAIDENLLDAWDDIEFKQFKFNDSVKEKGSNARFHTGTIAQIIADVCEKRHIDIDRYGLFCYDSWDAEDAEYDDSGNLIKEALEAGDRYSLRYEELLCVEAAWQRRKNKILEKRIADLEERLAALELRLGSD